MSGQLFTMNASTHKTVQELLPWFVTETLSSDELAMVQDHLNVCEQCRADMDWQRKLQGADAGSTTNLDVERALAKVLPRLGAQTAPKRDMLSTCFRALRNIDRQWMGWMLAAQTVAIVCLAVVLVAPIGNSGEYRLLGTTRTTAGNIVVVFKPETTEQDLRRILHASGARVIDGPTVTDAYLLQVKDARLKWAVNNLRSERGVALAESLESGGPHE